MVKPRGRHGREDYAYLQGRADDRRVCFAPCRRAQGRHCRASGIFGANQHIRKTADLYAAQGYLAIAPSLFDRVEPNLELGYTGDDPKKGIETRGKTELPKTLLDIEASVEAVKSAGKVGVVGYCWGGTLAYATAVNAIPGVAAAVGYYGGGVAAMSDKAPKDPDHASLRREGSFDLDGRRREGEGQPAADPVFVYAAGHGFNCDERASYDKESADLARSRTLAFFAEKLA